MQASQRPNKGHIRHSSDNGGVDIQFLAPGSTLSAQKHAGTIPETLRPSGDVGHNFTPPSVHPGQQIILDGDFLPANFRTQSYEIAKDSVRFVCRGECYGPAPSKAAVIMRSLVEDTIKDRSAMMAQLVRTLDVREREQLQLVRNIANNMFDDEQVNWSRIVTLHAFCGCLAKYCEQRNLPDCADDVANILADFVVNRLGLWIVTHGGWVSSCVKEGVCVTNWFSLLCWLRS